MQLVLYCVTKSEDIIQTPATGVGGSAVESVEDSGLRCFVSRTSGSGSTLGLAARESALAFHRVIQDIFRQCAVIPFRFPTMLVNQEEVAAHLREHAAEYHEACERLRHLVQMEVLIAYSGAKPGRNHAESTPSGAEYLSERRLRQVRLQSAAEAARAAASSLVRGWRQRSSQDRIRCFALIERGSVASFELQLSRVQMASDLMARISGPWPASAFLKEE